MILDKLREQRDLPRTVSQAKRVASREIFNPRANPE
jgi:hypothetical protein